MLGGLLHNVPEFLRSDMLVRDKYGHDVSLPDGQAGDVSRVNQPVVRLREDALEVLELVLYELLVR